MSRAIDADALEELFREVIGGIAKKPEMNGNLEHMVRASAMVIEMIQDAPTIEPERKKGQWIPEFNGMFKGGAYWFKCSECERIVPEVRNGGWNYCPNCGADMTEGKG